MVDFLVTLNFTVLILNLIIAGILINKKRKNITALFLAFYMLGNSGWAATLLYNGMYMSNEIYYSGSNVFLSLKILFLFAFIAFLSQFAFLRTFLEEKTFKIKPLDIIAIILFMVSIGLLFFTDLLFDSIRINYEGYADIKRSIPASIFLTAVFSFYLTCPIYIISQKLRKFKNEVAKSQLKILLLAHLFVIGGGLGANWFISVIFEIQKFNAAGPIFGIFYTGVFVYMLDNYRIFDLRINLHKAFSYSLTGITIGTLFYVTAYKIGSQNLFVYSLLNAVLIITFLLLAKRIHELSKKIITIVSFGAIYDHTLKIKRSIKSLLEQSSDDVITGMQKIFNELGFQLSFAMIDSTNNEVLSHALPKSSQHDLKNFIHEIGTSKKSISVDEIDYKEKYTSDFDGEDAKVKDLLTKNNMDFISTLDVFDEKSQGVVMLRGRRTISASESNTINRLAKKFLEKIYFDKLSKNYSKKDKQYKNMNSIINRVIKEVKTPLGISLSMLNYNRKAKIYTWHIDDIVNQIASFAYFSNQGTEKEKIKIKDEIHEIVNDFKSKSKHNVTIQGEESIEGKEIFLSREILFFFLNSLLRDVISKGGKPNIEIEYKGEAIIKIRHANCIMPTKDDFYSFAKDLDLNTNIKLSKDQEFYFLTISDVEQNRSIDR